MPPCRLDVGTCGGSMSRRMIGRPHHGIRGSGAARDRRARLQPLYTSAASTSPRNRIVQTATSTHRVTLTASNTSFSSIIPRRSDPNSRPACHTARPPTGERGGSGNRRRGRRDPILAQQDYRKMTGRESADASVSSARDRHMPRCCRAQRTMGASSEREAGARGGRRRRPSLAARDTAARLAASAPAHVVHLALERQDHGLERATRGAKGWISATCGGPRPGGHRRQRGKPGCGLIRCRAPACARKARRRSRASRERPKAPATAGGNSPARRDR
jgi:hypothetical protein